MQNTNNWKGPQLLRWVAPHRGPSLHPDSQQRRSVSLQLSLTRAGAWIVYKIFDGINRRFLKCAANQPLRSGCHTKTSCGSVIRFCIRSRSLSSGAGPVRGRGCCLFGVAIDFVLLGGSRYCCLCHIFLSVRREHLKFGHRMMSRQEGKRWFALPLRNVRAFPVELNSTVSSKAAVLPELYIDCVRTLSETTERQLNAKTRRVALFFLTTLSQGQKRRPSLQVVTRFESQCHLDPTYLCAEVSVRGLACVFAARKTGKSIKEHKERQSMWQQLRLQTMRGGIESSPSMRNEAGRQRVCHRIV